MNKPLPWYAWALPGLVGLGVFLLVSAALGQNILKDNERDVAAQRATLIIDQHRLTQHREQIDRELDEIRIKLATLTGQAEAIERIKQQVEALQQPPAAQAPVALPKPQVDGTGPAQ